MTDRPILFSAPIVADLSQQQRHMVAHAFGKDVARSMLPTYLGEAA